METRSYVKYPIAILLLALFWFATPVNAQTTTPPPDNGMHTAPPPPDRTTPPPPDRDHDVTRAELASFDHFLDGHPEIAEQVRKDPSLLDNREFLASHPGLEQYLKDHPEVRQEIRQNPVAFMRDEDRYDRREDNRGGDRGITRAEVVSFDHFLDSHPEIAEQLRKDPSLVDNRQFEKDHPGLEQYLQEHPEVRAELRQNPVAFMRDEDRYDRHDDRFRGETASFGEFLRGHAAIDSDLRRDPSLANNREFLNNHPELQEYLKAHPETERELTSDPQNFMKGFVGPPTRPPSTVAPPNPNPNPIGTPNPAQPPRAMPVGPTPRPSPTTPPPPNGDH